MSEKLGRVFFVFGSNLLPSDQFFTIHSLRAELVEGEVDTRELMILIAASQQFIGDLPVPEIILVHQSEDHLTCLKDDFSSMGINNVTATSERVDLFSLKPGDVVFLVEKTSLAKESKRSWNLPFDKAFKLKKMVLKHLQGDELVSIIGFEVLMENLRTLSRLGKFIKGCEDVVFIELPSKARGATDPRAKDAHLN